MFLKFIFVYFYFLRVSTSQVLIGSFGDQWRRFIQIG